MEMMKFQTFSRSPDKKKLCALCHISELTCVVRRNSKGDSAVVFALHHHP